VIEFADMPFSIIPSGPRHYSNRLVIQLQPEESIQLQMLAKEPGSGMKMVPVSLNLDLQQAIPERRAEAYERLLIDVIRGRLTHFMRRDELEAAWSWVEPILDGWKQLGDRPPLYGRHVRAGRVVGAARARQHVVVRRGVSGPPAGPRTRAARRHSGPIQAALRRAGASLPVPLAAAQRIDQVIDERRDPRRNRGVAVIHRVDRLVDVERVARQHLHEPPGLAILRGHEVRQADDARAVERELPQRLAARRPDRRLDAAGSPSAPRIGHTFSDSGCVKPSSVCLRSSSTLRGWPCAPRYGGREHPQPAVADAPAVQRRILEPADPIATSVRRSSRSMMPSLLFNSSSTFGKRSRRSRARAARSRAA
jgi:hypothetical protein